MNSLSFKDFKKRNIFIITFALIILVSAIATYKILNKPESYLIQGEVISTSPREKFTLIATVELENGKFTQLEFSIIRIGTKLSLTCYDSPDQVNSICTTIN